MWWNRRERSTWKGVAAGAVGGAVASFTMNQFQATMSKLFEERGDRGVQKKGREALGGRQHYPEGRRDPGIEERATVKTAAVISEALGHELEPDEKEWAGNLVHYAYGTAFGAAYGVTAEHWEEARAGEGTAFGAALWAVSDEVAAPVMGLSKGPGEYPLRTHAMALAAHLVYGVTTEVTRRVLRSGVLSR